MRLARLMISAMAASVAVLAFAAPAAALAGYNADLKDSQTPTTAANFKQEGDGCTGPFAQLDPGTDGWHFVLPAAQGDDFVALHLIFNNGTSNIDVVITSTDSSNPSNGSGWSGYIDNAGSSNKHAYVVTEAGWTLESGEAEVSPAPADGKRAEFNLSHTCAGTPSPSPSASETPSPKPSTSTSVTPSPKPSQSTSVSKTPSSSPSPSTPGLPVTGTAVGGIVLAGFGLVGAGIALMAVRRRRDMGDIAGV